MTFTLAAKRRPHHHPTDPTSGGDGSLARLRRSGSKVLRLLSPRSTRAQHQLRSARTTSPTISGFDAENDVDCVLPRLNVRDSFEIARHKTSQRHRSARSGSRGSNLRQARKQEQVGYNDTFRLRGSSGKKAVDRPAAQRSPSKSVLSPSSWLPGDQLSSELDGSGRSPDMSPVTPKKRQAGKQSLLDTQDKDYKRRVVSTPDIPLKRRLSAPASTVTRRPGAACAMPIPFVEPANKVRQPTHQATLHPVAIASQRVPNDSACHALVSGVWSPLLTLEESGQTSISDLRLSPSKAIEDAQYMREVRFDLPPIREVPTPALSHRLPQQDVKICQDMTMTAAEEQLVATAALAEQCATTKIFFETLYHNIRVESQTKTPRSMRRRQMEDSLTFICSTVAQQAEARQTFNQMENEHLRTVRCLKSRRNSMSGGISQAGYELVRLLGKGSFGIVSLVREKRLNGRSSGKLGRSGTVYAMKVIKKSEMLRQCQEAHLRIERDFMVKAAERSNWIVPLVASFQDIDHLYLVMDFQIGGDFLNLLMSARHGIISEADTRFYVAEIILCVGEAHNMKIIHRDIKPDNFLISASGHLKLADFGLAFDGHWSHKQSYFTGHRYAMMQTLGAEVLGDEEDQQVDAKTLPRPSLDGQPWCTNAPSQSKDFEARFTRRKMARSIVGTSQYMAPEVIAGEHYDGRCDWWSVGIILFECLFGATPFVRDDRQQTKEAIANFQHEFPWDVYTRGPQRVSHEAADLINALLQVRERRLCSDRYQSNDFIRARDGLHHVNDLDRGCHDYRGRYVYPNDAEQLKRHPFFQGINWHSLHHTQPPFKPACKHEDSCRYFDTEEEILKDYMDESMSAEDAKKMLEEEINGLDGEHKRTKPKQPAKRARDKLLRDPLVGRAVLQERKKGAFLGYTYRRPNTWSLGNELRLGGDNPTFWDADSMLAWPGSAIS